MRYAVFICTHGRPDSQLTLNALRKAGYTGLIFLVLDDEDETGVEYLKYENDNTKILVFNKQEWIDKSETGSITEVRKTILYAKNFCEWIACEQFKLDAYILADDDIFDFMYPFEPIHIHHTLQDAINLCVSYVILNDIGMLGLMRISQNIEEHKLLLSIKVADKFPYHIVIRNCSHRYKWHSYIGQDLLGDIDLANVGSTVFNTPLLLYNIEPNGKKDGGMRETYIDNSSYNRTLEIFKHYPGSLSIHYTGDIFEIHTNDFTILPEIISSRYKK